MTDFNNRFQNMQRRHGRMRAFAKVWFAFVFSVMFLAVVGFGWLVTHPETIGFYIGRYGDRIVAGVIAAQGGK